MLTVNNITGYTKGRVGSGIPIVRYYLDVIDLRFNTGHRARVGIFAGITHTRHLPDEG